MRRWTLLILGLFLIGALGASAGLAQSGGDFSLEWFTVDGGGGTSDGGQFALSGTIGQADAETMVGGGYTLEGGYWGVGTAFQSYLYLPAVVKNP